MKNNLKVSDKLTDGVIYAIACKIENFRLKIIPRNTLREKLFRKYIRPIFVRIFLKQTYHLNAPSVISRQTIKLDRSSIKRIVVLKLDHIGDFVLGLPAFEMLRSAFPDAYLTLISGTWNNAIANSVGLFDEIINLNVFHEISGKDVGIVLDKTQIGFLKSLQRFDLAIDLKVEDHTRPILNLLPADFKAAYGFEDDHWQIVLPYPRRVPNNVSAPHTQLLLKMLTFAVVDSVTQDPTADLLQSSLPNRTQDKVGGTLRIGVGIGSGAETRNWPINNFVEVINTLNREYQTEVYLFGSKEQFEEAESLKKLLCNTNVTNFSGHGSLVDFCDRVRSVDVYIGNNTGSTHIASGLNVPTICISGNSLEKFRPVGKFAVSLSTDLPCAPCGLKRVIDCPNGFKCLMSIRPDRVVYELRTLLKNYKNTFAPSPNGPPKTGFSNQASRD